MRRVLWVVALALLAPGARADNKATAEALYEQGKTLLREGKYSEACPKFAASHEADPSMGALLHLADCLEKRGQLASSWATFREAVSFASRSQDARRKIAEDRAKSLEPRLPRLVLTIQNQPPGLKVQRNGELIPAASFGSPLPVDPGEQKIEASAPQKKLFATTITLKEGQTMDVLIPSLADETPEPGPRPSAAVPASSPPAASAPPSETPTAALTKPPASNRATIGLALGAAGVVGLGLGSYFGLHARSLWNQSKPLCAGTRCSHEGALLAQDAQTSGTISTVSFALGAAALGAGAFFFFTGRQSDAVQVGGAAAPSGGFVSVKGAF